MADKSEARLALEEQAQDLGLTFPANIGDEKLQAKIDEALADLKQPALDRDEKAAANAATAQGGQDASQETPAPDVPMVTVQCHKPEGRRRAGRRWDGGVTEVPLADLSDDMLDKLRADPIFTLSGLPEE